jgi:hypothetical protein
VDELAHVAAPLPRPHRRAHLGGQHEVVGHRHPLLDPARYAALPYAAHELARWLSLRCAPCTAALLARAADVSPEHATDTLRSLVDAGVAREASGGAFVLVVAPPDPWSPERRRAAHARFVDASEPGDPGRLHHALEGRVLIATLRAQLHATTTRLVQAGRIGSAREVLTVTVRALLGRAGVCADDLADAFTLWLRVVLEQWTLSAVDELALAVSTAHAQLGGLTVFERLADAARCRLQSAEAATAVLRALPPMGDVALELIRREIRFYALGRDPDAQRRELAEAEAAAPRHPDFARFFAACRARLAYATGDFADAMREHLRTAEGETWAGRALRAQLNAAAAALEAGHLPEAARWSAEVRERAEALRLPAIEAQALYFQRATAWRQGDDAPPEPAWIEAARHVDPTAMRYLAFNDAARAWRARDLAAFCMARDAAVAAEGQAAESLSRSMLVGMAVDLGIASLTPEDRERVLVTTERLVPRIALQVAALTHRAARGRRDDPRWRRYADAVPSALWATRLDVMSVDDCLARLDVTVPSAG